MQEGTLALSACTPIPQNFKSDILLPRIALASEF